MFRTLACAALAALSLSAIAPAALGQSSPHAEHAAETGDLTLSGAFTRATLPGAQVGGGYVTIENAGETDDRLVAARSPVAAEVQVHEMSMVNDVMQMRHLQDGVAVPAGGTVDLAPGGLHLMLMGLTAPLVEGETVPVTLVFEHAGEVEIALQVLSFSASASDDHSAHQGHH